MKKKKWEGMAQDFYNTLMKEWRAIHVNASDKIRDSILYGPNQEGGRLTGAPGQPVDTGNLRASWQRSFPKPLYSEIIATGKTPDGKDVGYAKAIEEGVVQTHTRGPYTRSDGTPVREHTVRGWTIRYRSGGPHSVKLTKNNFDKILRKAIEEETRD